MARRPARCYRYCKNKVSILQLLLPKCAPRDLRTHSRHGGNGQGLGEELGERIDRKLWNGSGRGGFHVQPFNLADLPTQIANRPSFLAVP